MSKPRRLVIASTAVLMLLVISGAAGQSGSVPQSQSGPVAVRSQPQTEQAYSLPPAKLAQAIALNKIRVALDIAGSLWGLILVWGLLASGTAVRLDAWTRETMRQRWIQGLAFFTVLIVLLTLANLPLDAIGHAASLHYGISVQGWPSWLGDQGKGLAVSVIVGVPVTVGVPVGVGPQALTVTRATSAVPLNASVRMSDSWLPSLVLSDT